MTSFILSITSGVLVSIIVGLYNDNKKLRQAKKEADKVNKKADDDLILGLARLTLKNSIETALERGYTTTGEYDVIYELFTAYINKGGNGTVKHLFNDRYNSLKVKEE